MSSHTANRPAQIVLVDDHHVVRSGLRSLIDFESDLVVVGEAGSVEDAVELVSKDPPDLVVMDVRLPDGSGISACHHITTLFPDVKVMILTSYANDVALSSAVAANAAGYVLKNVRAAELISDIRHVLEGGKIFDRVGEDRLEEPFLTALSPQELTVADHLADGLTNREIAREMDLAEKTVKNYVSNVLTKLGMTRRSEAAAHVARIRAMTGASIAGRRGMNAG